jgi:hypothetical protein
LGLTKFRTELIRNRIFGKKGEDADLTTVLTGFTTGANTSIASTDTILAALEKAQGQINARLSAIEDADILNVKESFIFNKEEIIKGKFYQKLAEDYQIIDKNGEIIAHELADLENNFEQHFFERYDVKVALRKYKLSRLKLFKD